MQNNQTVIGSYRSEEEAEHVIRRLLSEGYARNDITIFTSESRSTEINPPRDIAVSNPDVNGTDEDQGNDRSFWESLKDAFSVRDDEYYDDPNYTAEDDLLHLYRDDLRKGNLVVVVRNYNGDREESNRGGSDRVNTDSVNNRNKTSDLPTADHPADTHMETLGTTAGFPTEGTVQGMGDGGQRPMEPKTNDGVPPELEDTHGESDPDAATKERMRQTRNRNTNPESRDSNK